MKKYIKIRGVWFEVVPYESAKGKRLEAMYRSCDGSRVLDVYARPSESKLSIDNLWWDYYCKLPMTHVNYHISSHSCHFFTISWIDKNGHNSKIFVITPSHNYVII